MIFLLFEYAMCYRRWIISVELLSFVATMQEEKKSMSSKLFLLTVFLMGLPVGLFFYSTLFHQSIHLHDLIEYTTRSMTSGIYGNLYFV